jgi:hypothetical protein
MSDYAADDTHLVVPVAPRLRSKSYHTVMKKSRKSQMQKEERKSSIQAAFGKFLEDIHVDDEVNLKIEERRQRHPPRRVKSASSSGVSATATRPARRGVRKPRSSNLLKSNGAFHDSNSGLRSFLAHEEKQNDQQKVSDEGSLVSIKSTKSRSRVRNSRRTSENISDDNLTNRRAGTATRRRSIGSMADAGIGRRPSVASVTEGADSLMISSKSISGETVASAPVDRSQDEKFLKERKSRQDEILGVAMNERKKVEEKKKREDEPVPSKKEEENGRFKIKRRPSFSGLRDARKRVQEKFTEATASDSLNKEDMERKGAKKMDPEKPEDEDREEDLKGDPEYDSRQLRDRTRTSLFDRVSGVVSTPETKKKFYREKRMQMQMKAPTVASGVRVNESSWDL